MTPMTSAPHRTPRLSWDVMGEEIRDKEREGRDVAGPIMEMGRRATRFSKEFVATLVAVVSTALGVVVALAWNEALQALFTAWLHSARSQAVAKVVYAVILTAIAVVTLISLGKLAHRLDVQPLEFKYPGGKKNDEESR